MWDVIVTSNMYSTYARPFVCASSRAFLQLKPCTVSFAYRSRIMIMSRSIDRSYFCREFKSHLPTHLSTSNIAQRTKQDRIQTFPPCFCNSNRLDRFGPRQASRTRTCSKTFFDHDHTNHRPTQTNSTWVGVCGTQ
jgi:hypothetical protein